MLALVAGNAFFVIGQYSIVTSRAGRRSRGAGAAAPRRR
jgi:hypothetical protein